MPVSRNVVPPFAFSTTHILHAFTFFRITSFVTQICPTPKVPSGICTKRFTKDQDGAYVGLDQSIGYLFDYSSVQINSLSALSELLSDLESSKHAFVIRGNLIEGR